MVKKILITVSAVLLAFIGCFCNATKVNTKQIRVREETIRSEKTDDDLDGLLLCFFSDLDYGSFFDDEQLDRTVAEINAFQPDIIVFGGDLFVQETETSGNREHLRDALASLTAVYGKYAVLGERDLLHRSICEELLTDAGFHVIDDTCYSISIDKDSSINLIGLSCSGQQDIALNELFVSDQNRFTFVISHYPDRFDDVLIYDFDRFLAGHSLGGQIYLPLISLFGRTTGCRKHFKGKTVRNGKTLDISNGLGRIGSNARFLADAEIVLYTLRKTKE